MRIAFKKIGESVLEEYVGECVVDPPLMFIVSF